MDIGALPTILDVVEEISKLENRLILPSISTVPSPQFFDEGRFNYVSERNNRMAAHLMPTSQSPYTFYRGQSQYFEPCLPSLYRGGDKLKRATEEDIAFKRIQICEFARLLDTHPVFAEVSRNTMAHPVALAQHYGFATEYLDITNSKWVAAFFASTGYDWKTDTYYPVGREYGNGYGVVYVSKDVYSEGKSNEFFEKNGVIGYQYFDRPTKQSSFGFRMESGEDFNVSPYFHNIFFRHDIEASTIVFEMSYKQHRFIPRDTLSKLAREIMDSKEVSRAAVELCRQVYFPDTGSSAFLDAVCMQNGVKIREDNSPIVQYPQEELDAEWKAWNEFGRADLESRILPIMPVAILNLSDTTSQST